MNRPVLPWLVSAHDFGRYMSRALRAIEKSPQRVVFIGYSAKGKRTYVCLMAASAKPVDKAAAISQFKIGCFRRVTLSRLPPIRRRQIRTTPRIPRAVMSAGRDLFTTKAAFVAWLKTPAAWASGETPEQLIRTGRAADVLGACKGLLYGNYL